MNGYQAKVEDKFVLKVKTLHNKKIIKCREGDKYPFNAKSDVELLKEERANLVKFLEFSPILPEFKNDFLYCRSALLS